MEWAGWVSLFILICAINIPGDVKKLKRKVRLLETKLKQRESKKEGENVMSLIIQGLVGEECIIESNSAAFIGMSKVECKVLEADEEWIKISFLDKKKGLCTKIFRIDEIDNIELKA